MTAPPLLNGPIAPYSNPPIEPQFYEPSRFFISSITLGNPTTITTTANTNFVIGQQVRLVIPPLFGTRQLNQQIAYVIGIPAPNQVTLDISSQGYDAFILVPSVSQAQILPIGDINSGALNASGSQNLTTYIPGSFRNISPI